jgi:hypothetical protein
MEFGAVRLTLNLVAQTVSKGGLLCHFENK